MILRHCTTGIPVQNYERPEFLTFPCLSVIGLWSSSNIEVGDFSSKLISELSEAVLAEPWTIPEER